MTFLLGGVIGAGMMYLFAGIVSDRVCDKVIKEISDLIDDKLD